LKEEDFTKNCMKYNLKINYPGPGKILRGENLKEEIRKELSFFGDKVLVIGDEDVFNKFKNYLKFALSKTKNFIGFFNGECSYEEIERLRKMGNSNRVNSIFCFGGGKSIDTGKMVSFILNKPLVVLPTSTSTCACYSHHSVIYEKEGQFIEEQDSKNTDSIFIDYEILLKQPLQLFSSGIVDALSKFYEMKTIKGSIEELALNIDKRIYVSIFSNYKKLKKEFLNETLTEDLKYIFDLSLLYPGLVGYMGGRILRSGIAHSFANAFTSLIPKYKILKKHTHGEFVGFGLQFLLYIKEKFDELVNLRRLLNTLEMPLNFNDFGIGNIGIEDIKILAKKIISQEIYDYKKDEKLIFNAIVNLGNN